MRVRGSPLSLQSQDCRMKLRPSLSAKWINFLRRYAGSLISRGQSSREGAANTCGPCRARPIFRSRDIPGEGRLSRRSFSFWVPIAPSGLGAYFGSRGCSRCNTRFNPPEKSIRDVSYEICDTRTMGISASVTRLGSGARQSTPNDFGMVPLEGVCAMWEQDAGRKASRKFATSSALEMEVVHTPMIRNRARGSFGHSYGSPIRGSPGNCSDGREGRVCCCRGLLGTGHEVYCDLRGWPHRSRRPS